MIEPIALNMDEFFCEYIIKVLNVNAFMIQSIALIMHEFLIELPCSGINFSSSNTHVIVCEFKIEFSFNVRIKHLINSPDLCLILDRIDNLYITHQLIVKPGPIIIMAETCVYVYVCIMYPCTHY